jgi:hypothetical protein
VSDPGDIPYADIAYELLHGRVVPFIGAGVNRTQRPEGAKWDEDCAFLPDGGELAGYLASRFEFEPPLDGDRPDLLRTAQYAAVVQDPRKLYDALSDVFHHDVEPTEVHRFIARAQRTLRDKGKSCQVIVTSNYDDLMERALQEQHEAFDVVWYQARTKHKLRGRYFHRRWDSAQGGFETAKSVPVRSPTSWAGADLAQRATVLKVHGAIDRHVPDGDSYVITEDDYIEYMTAGDVLRQIPSVLLQPMRTGRLLFLGYSLKDWNLRVFFRGIVEGQELETNWWAVQTDVTDHERRMWSTAAERVRLFDQPLGEFVARLRAEMGESPATPPTAT